ncbi:acetylcholine receptor subunit alpha [Biomphalaria glabrata]|uniref:Neurotransmitter-gated ion-channel ligand-binding domain-containing protein n=1 Tax=Biomphalaria glabrata TaxID=6526 RepID=A0A2C9LYQ6_BIOGL|nr:acetylcholine receptor subunit alpha [Biomphalaria glabrata]
MKEKGFLSVATTLSLLVGVLVAQTYNSTVAIMKELVENGEYHTEVRPLKDQAQVMRVTAEFEIVSIVRIDDVTQSFTANGFLLLNWTDELLTWDPDKYSNQTLIHPVPENIWRPRVVLMNTLEDRDLFENDVAPVFINNKGYVSWVPGSLIPSSCELHMADYPFDKQTCTITFLAMKYTTSELVFVPGSVKVKQDFFIKHGEWDLTDTSLNVTDRLSGYWKGSAIQLTFTMKRRPAFLLINIVLPVVFLSFLNLLVFLIPAKSGEKISYGITVLLALSVFISIVSGMLPRSGTEIPKLTIYLFLLLIISMLTVIDSIIIVYLAHKDEEKTSYLKAKENFKSLFSKTRRMTQTVTTMMNRAHQEDCGQDEVKEPRRMTPSILDILKRVPQVDCIQDELQESQVADSPHPRSASSVNSKDEANQVKGSKVTLTPPGVNNYRLISKHIDRVSFFVFFILWIFVTLGFLCSMSF